MSMVSFALCCHHWGAAADPARHLAIAGTRRLIAHLRLKHASGSGPLWGSSSLGLKSDFELRPDPWPDRGPDRGADRGPDRRPNRGPVTAHLFRALAGVLPMGGLL